MYYNLGKRRTRTVTGTFFYGRHLLDPASAIFWLGGCRLRSYQRGAAASIFYDAMTRGGHDFAVMFPRQSGKNELQAQLENLLLELSRGKDASRNIVKVAPTACKQGAISEGRLAKILRVRGVLAGVSRNSGEIFFPDDSRRVRFLSAHPGSLVVGDTADLLLEVDEAQDVPGAEFEHEILPMAASTNATRVFWGTAWDENTLLARSIRSARESQNDLSLGVVPLVHVTTGDMVADEVPAYRVFLADRLRQLGREHPMVRTQYFCEEIGDTIGMFGEERIRAMQGTHHVQEVRESGDAIYVFLIDVASSYELLPETKKSEGFSDVRDCTALTICQILPREEEEAAEGCIWHAVARRSYRNLSAESLHGELVREIGHLSPDRVVIDATGVGSGVAAFLFNKYGAERVVPVEITSKVKTDMAWDFLAMLNTGRWLEYACGENDDEDYPAVPLQDGQEVISAPGRLQERFYREARAARMEPQKSGSVRWGVPEGLRDSGSGRIIHDDMIFSAALSTIVDRSLPAVMGFSEDSDPYDGVKLDCLW